jgi:SAM-dependent methyltransferase
MLQLSDEALRQGELWGASARDWAELQEPAFQPLYEAVLDALQVKAGTAFLDAGCGSGGASLAAAHRGAQVSGIDVSVPMVTVARERLPKADFRIAELQEIPFANGQFDAVAAINSVQLAGDPRLAAFELGRVARTGGLVGIVVFAAPERCDLGAVFRAIVELFPSRPSGSGPFGLSGAGELESLIRATDGIRPRKVLEIDCPCVYADIDAAARAHLAAGPSVRAVQILGRDRVAEAVRKALRPFERGDGRVAMTNRFRCALGEASAPPV